MAVIEGLGGNLGDALHRACNSVLYGVLPIEHGEKIIVNDNAGIVLTHGYFLGDYPLLLADRFLGEVGSGNKVEQKFQIVLKFLGAAEIIGGHAA